MTRHLSVALALAASIGCTTAPPIDAPPRGSKAVDPVCGAEVDEMVPWRETVGRSVFYFHREECRQEFRNNPEAFLGNPRYPNYRRAHPPQYSEDVVCGRMVDLRTPWMEEFAGQPYYFHSDDCRRTFTDRPQAFVGRPAR